jgi:hypothetical protein
MVVEIRIDSVWMLGPSPPNKWKQPLAATPFTSPCGRSIERHFDH